MLRKRPASDRCYPHAAPAVADTHRLSVPWHYCVYKREESGLLRFSHVGYQHLVKHVPKMLCVRNLREGYQRGNAHSAMRAPVMVLIKGASASVFTALGWREEDAREYSTDVTGWGRDGKHMYRTECEDEAFAELRFFATINAYALDEKLQVPRLQTVDSMYCASVYLPLTLECGEDLTVLERECTRCFHKANRDCVLTISTPEGGLNVYHEDNHAPLVKRRCTIGPRTPSVPPPVPGGSSASSTSSEGSESNSSSSEESTMMRASFQTGLYLSETVMRSLCCTRGKETDSP